MNRGFFFIAMTLLMYNAGIAQNKMNAELSPSNKSRYKVIYPMETINTSITTLPFSAIEIRDIRPDTTKLGFYRSTKDRHSYKYRFTHNTSDELTTLLSQHFKKNLTPGSDNQLVIYIKKLWLSEFDSAELNMHNTHTRNAWLYVKAEMYLRNKEDYYPVYRLDSIVYAHKDNSYTSGGFITGTLLHGLQQLLSMDYNRILGKRKMAIASIEAFNSRSLTTGGPKPIRGVYQSFADFKTNRPSFSNFEVRFESLADIVYVKEPDGSMYPRKNVWGFSDGETVFIRMGSNFFPLYNQQNTWEFYGSAATEARGFRMPLLAPALPVMLASAGVAELSQTYEKRLVNLRAFQVDVENGKFY